MNRLPARGEDTWRLPRHAHIIVHETSGEELITIYDCGAAQQPPSAQVTGNLVRVRVDHETVPQPNGYIAKLRGPALLERQDEVHWVVRERTEG